MKTQYYTASSIDGFIADRENSLGWLLSRTIDQEGPMAYSSFFTEVGAVAAVLQTTQWQIPQTQLLTSGAEKTGYSQLTEA